MYIYCKQESRGGDLRCLESQERRVADHASHETTTEFSHFVRVFVKVFLVKAENPLVPLKEHDWASVVQLAVKGLDHLLLKSNQFLLINNYAPLVLNKTHHAIERRRDRLLKLG